MMNRSLIKCLIICTLCGFFFRVIDNGFEQLFIKQLIEIGVKCLKSLDCLFRAIFLDSVENHKNMYITSTHFHMIWFPQMSLQSQWILLWSKARKTVIKCKTCTSCMGTETLGEIENREITHTHTNAMANNSPSHLYEQYGARANTIALCRQPLFSTVFVIRALSS